MNLIFYDVLFDQLLKSSRIRIHSLATAPTDQGAYAVWLDTSCLKVGIAGPRKGKGLSGRLELHFSSNPDNSVLARHMVADATPSWASGYDFRNRQDRAKFLDERCYVQAIALPDFTRRQLLDFEKFLVTKLCPRYKGRVSKRSET
jgi:hypothetical protein